MQRMRLREKIKKDEHGGRIRRNISKNVWRNRWNHREDEVRKIFNKLNAVPQKTEKKKKKRGGKKQMFKQI